MLNYFPIAQPAMTVHILQKTVGAGVSAGGGARGFRNAYVLIQQTELGSAVTKAS